MDVLQNPKKQHGKKMFVIVVKIDLGPQKFVYYNRELITTRNMHTDRSR